ncbi:threonine-phosphate decarboxylase [Thiocapsa imhoffii]|uniref:threonine-phosphate decarboxylase n=1 Tax=Thiocapsa imhoffii TaxID=382777 RepID=A0A9X1B8G5_9GAMM|nr:threonine-phosphate decarboxylase CobD [Thiocapsa imhoffii]MBK1644884.1 threonine-phosphate decarboxylase [Thiocapsa imhoffii]
MSALVHGGNLREAAEIVAIPLADWLDLSTGINPDGWPVPALPAAVWNRLPQEDDGLNEAAASYYGTDELLPVAGSQAAIQMLPRLRQRARVGVPEVGYQEHAQAWQAAGHELVRLRDGDPHQPLDGSCEHLGVAGLDVLVVINPTNPTGRRWPVTQLLEWHAQLAARGGWLLVDEAFIDPRPGDSLAPYTGRPGLILLRSLGKFFGLAGARVGFVLATGDVRRALRGSLGPWALAGPSRQIAQGALRDRDWQEAARGRLVSQSVRLAALLRRRGLDPQGGTELFQWVCTDEAVRLQMGLAEQGIWVRRFTHPVSLRFGLPGAQADWDRLAAALERLTGHGSEGRSATDSLHLQRGGPGPHR